MTGIFWGYAPVRTGASYEKAAACEPQTKFAHIDTSRPSGEQAMELADEQNPFSPAVTVHSADVELSHSDDEHAVYPM